jgi:hypothetical protein
MFVLLKAFSSEVASLKPLAGVGVAYSGREESEAQGQHDGVQHEVLRCERFAGEKNSLLALSAVEVPPGA